MSGEEREYTFEEADEATLAELGLLDGGADPWRRRCQIRPSETKPARAAEAGSPSLPTPRAATPRPAAPKSRSRKAPTTTGAEAPAAPVGG